MTDTTWQIADDRKTVEVTLDGNALTLTTHQVELLIAGLGHMRSKMVPEVSKQWDTRTPLRAQPDPAWVLEPGGMVDGVLLHLRNTKFGWLHYVIPTDEAKKLASGLTQMAEIKTEVTAPANGAVN